MTGWLTKDVEELTDLIKEFCKDCSGCSNCYWYSAKPHCIGEIAENIDISLDNLKKSITRAKMIFQHIYN